MAVKTRELITDAEALALATRIGHNTTADEVVAAYRDHADLIRQYMDAGFTQEGAVGGAIVNTSLKRE
jgi:hypothetical protein